MFFVLAAYVEVAGFHYSLKTLTAAAGAPLFAPDAPKSAGGYGGLWIDRLLELVVFFDMLAVAIGCAVSASRGIFAMARDRRIPGVLAVTSRRHNSPLGATAFLVGALLMAIGSPRSYGTAPGRFWLLVSAVLAIVITAGAIFGSFYK